MTDHLAALVAKDAIVDVITRLFIATDERDWAAVRACLAPSLHVDMSSAGAGPAGPMSAEALVRGWETNLRPLEAIHHQAGNFRVTVAGERASAFCYGIATHYRPTSSGRNTRTFVGSYAFDLALLSPEEWRITSFQFHLKYLDGNLTLEQG
jgi:hypothetical protein